MPRKEGERVGAILGAKDGKVEFFGYGVFEGDHVPNEAIGWIAESLIANKIPNPRIRLDNGGVVYGCECWWGPEEAVKKRLEQYETVVEVDVNEWRKSIGAGEKSES